MLILSVAATQNLATITQLTLQVKMHKLFRWCCSKERRKKTQGPAETERTPMVTRRIRLVKTFDNTNKKQLNGQNLPAIKLVRRSRTQNSSLERQALKAYVFPRKG